MKIFDCFLFNDEIEILYLRLKIMSPYVNQFLIVESSKTFSGIEKESNYRRNQTKFACFGNQINYHFIDCFPETKSTWELECYLRDCARSLVKAEDNDLVIIGDVDEILNMPAILSKLVKNNFYSLIQLRTFYYYLNCQSTELINVTLISEFKNIKNMLWGDRSRFWAAEFNLIEDTNGENGGHFTYQFGTDIRKYEEKIKSFSHQEFNNRYYLNPIRLNKCIRYRVDLFDRDFYSYRIVSNDKLFQGISENISESQISTLAFAPIFGVGDLQKWFDPFFLQIILRRLKLNSSIVKGFYIFVERVKKFL